MRATNGMRVSNAIAKPAQKEDFESKVVEYKCGEEMVKLSPSIIRKYLVRGNGKVTDQEVAMFLNLCRFQHLNPFLNEAYLLKYGNQDATIVIGKEVFTKRARRNPDYEGQEAGVVIFHEESGQFEYRTGALMLPGERLVGGWAKVYVKGYQVPQEMVVSYEEYVGRKKDGEINSQWKSKPATMIRKVALVQCLRECFPEDLEGMYASEELGVDFNEATMAPVDVENESVQVVVDQQEIIEQADEPIEELPGDF